MKKSGDRSSVHYAKALDKAMFVRKLAAEIRKMDRKVSETSHLALATPIIREDRLQWEDLHEAELKAWG